MTKIFKNVFWVVLFVLPLFLSAQQEGKELSSKEQRKFDYHFYEASRYVAIERFDKAIAEYLECYKIDETNATISFQLAKLYLGQDEQEKGESFLIQAYELDPNNKWIALGMAKYYQEYGSPEKAISIYENLVEIYPNEVGYLIELSELHYHQKEYKKCIKDLEKIENLVGISAELSQQKKDIYLLLDDEDGARKELEKLVEAFPVNVEYMGALAQFYNANGHTDAAIIIYDRMLELDSNDPRAHMDLANIYRNRDEFKKSYEHLRIALASPQLDVELKLKVLYSFYQEGQNDPQLFDMGIELLQLSIDATPNESKLYAMMGDFLLWKEDVQEARNLFRKAARLGANHIQIWSQILLLDADLNNNDSLIADSKIFIELYPNQPLGYMMAGGGYFLKDQYEQSVEMYESGLDFVIENPELEEQFYISLADGYHQLGNHLKSDGYFEKAMDINPNNPTVLNNYAYYLSVRGVRLTFALEMADRCNKLAPNNAIFLDTWAWALYKNGKYQEALEKIIACADLGGATSGEVIEHWGDILYRLNKVEEAVDKWKEAAKKDDASAGIQDKIRNRSLNE